MRVLFTLLIFSALLCCTTQAADQFSDVPLVHWSYRALNYLTERNVLEGYPQGIFSGDRALTRLEFAQATARLIEYVGALDDGSVGCMVEMLRSEYSPELELLSENIAEVGTGVTGLQYRVDSLESASSAQAATLADVEEKVGKLRPSPQWGGQLLDRWDFSSQDSRQRFAHRILLQVGYSKQIEENLQLGLRLRTNTGNAPNSSTWILGHDGKTTDIFLDRAYVKYSPHWFGAYAADSGNCAPRLDIYAGMYPNTTRDQYYMVFDTDLNFQGLGLVYHFNQDFQIQGVASILAESQAGAYVDDDTYLLAWELRHHNLGLTGLDAWLGCYSFEHPGNLPAAYFTDNSLSSFDFNNDGETTGADRFSSNFNTIKGGLQYTWDCEFDKPLSLYSEYMVNTRSDAKENIEAVNPLVTTDIIYHSSDDRGFLVGAQLGAPPAEVGDWMAYVRYKEIGANAIIDGLGDAGVGGANVNSLEASCTWKWVENCQLGITCIINKMHNDFGHLVPSLKDDQQILMIDWLFSF